MHCDVTIVDPGLNAYRESWLEKGLLLVVEIDDVSFLCFRNITELESNVKELFVGLEGRVVIHQPLLNGGKTFIGLVR
jgi:hypothetical protein